MKTASFDRNRAPLAIGDRVSMFVVPEHLLDGLPKEDQVAINAQVGKVLVVEGIEQDARIELEFKDDAGHFHTIWINPNCLEKIVNDV